MQAAMAGGGDIYMRSHTNGILIVESLIKLGAALQTPL